MLGLIAACEGPLDYDLRGQIGAFSTSNAAQNATTGRPQADDRGLITYPNYQVAVARRGDTVADIATRIGMPVDEVARFNGVQAGDRLRPGEVLALPRRAPEQVISGSAANPGSVDIEQLAGSAIEGAATTSPNPGSVTTTQLQPAPSRIEKPEVQDGPEPVRHRVARGETAYTVSRLYQVPVKALAEWNGLGSDFAIREGQYLLIPLKDKSAPALASPVAASAVTVPGQGTTTPTPPSSTRPLPQETVAAAAEAQALPDIEVPQPSRSSQAAMSYPVQGKIIRTYSKGKNDGIDIAANAGAPVQAARSGTVAAITADSNKVPIIVIRHDDKLLTVYANVDNIAIKKGDRVKRGQTIATLRSGDDAYVHFEVRDGFDSVDPLPYLQ
ncbi:peptidoglycan DD-metalloendopeptidase family protein [Parasedimentitalea psychrophila]|uniref:Peptidoglycan DD-metalloendopeptidase family protein n=2 Tax=Parasedimentitalea psychrophila TaxID=2997337 RepID=A0A9Y2L480_9RHOB|nr:peptidoglycan DD-metalloendopeptidase family protein [Parasedimentitalea psychrophila]WIY27684.1 peptidoglycan DD-metalloendopeptidase family protein [Parasedimentitalea psychrophila]